MKKKRLKKLTFTNNTDILLGFEVECVILGKHREDFDEFLSRHKKYVYSSGDGSICWSCDCKKTFIRVCDFCDKNTRGIEIKTKPLRSKSAMELLQLVFDVVNVCGTTNESCGFHVNISSSVKRKMINFNPLTFLNTNLWNSILKKFDRNKNHYCLPLDGCEENRPMVSRLLNLLDNNDCFDGKGSCVSFNGFDNGRVTPHSRVEIRGFGNADYTKKLDIIASYIKKIETTFSNSCEA